MQDLHEALPIITATTSFVGRRREVGLLQHHFAASVGGQTRVVLVSGEPGIGKTRLLRYVAEKADEQGVPEGTRVMHGGTSEAQGMPAYLPFLEALGRHIRSAESDLLREQLGTHASTLASIFPELPARLGELPSSYPLPPEQARLRLFEAVADFLVAIAHRDPLILLLDDLHWADPASLDLLCHVPRHQPAARLLILGTYRTAEAEQNDALWRAISELMRQRVLTMVTLGPLSADETEALAAVHLGRPVSAQLSLLLHSQSEGNPFFAEELLADWIETGALQPEREDRVPFAPREALPPSLVRAIQQRLTRLSTELVNQLRVAAILGRSFHVSLLAEVMDQDMEATEELLLGAVHADLILSDGTGTFTFKHDTVRECLYAEVSSTRRQRLHQRIGEALEKGNADPVSQHLAKLAFHFARSGDRTSGVAYSLQAAEHATLSHAPEEAMAHYRTALDLLDPADTRRGEIMLALGNAALSAGHEDEAVAVYGDARRLLTQADNPVAAARASHGLGIAKWRQGALHEAQIALEAAVTLLGDLGSLLNAHMGLQAEGLAVARRALDLAHELGNSRLEAAASRTVGQLTAWGNDIPGGMQLLERALVLATAADDPAEAAEICGILANLYFACLDIERSRQITVMRTEYAQQCHQPYELRHVHSWLAELALQQGDWAQTEQLIAQAQDMIGRLAGDEPRAVLHRVRGLMASYRGRFAEAERWHEEAIAIARPKGPQHLAWYLGSLGLVRLALGKRKEALASMLELEAVVGQLPDESLPTAPALTALVELAVQLSDLERAATYVEQLRAFEGRMFLSLVDTALAAHELARRDWPAAETYLARAERDARRAGFRPLLFRILQDQAELELARGGPESTDHALAALDEALALCAELEIEGEADQIRERLHRLSTIARRPFRTPLPAGLTQREAEVLRLVAAGKSNRQIGSELCMSEKTVEKHLTGILNKTSSENRAAATAFAVRHGLA